MAKQQEQAESTGELASTTLSTRFTAKQREVLERAAAIANCAPAKLIREATLQRAADIINASGRAGVTLRWLAQKALQPMVNPLVELRWGSRHPEEGEQLERMTLDAWESLTDDEKEAMMDYHQGAVSMTAKPVRLDANEIRQIRAALKTCPTEFARMMVEQWESVESGGESYHPTVSAQELLSGEGEP